MPRFHFNVSDGVNRPDLEGMVLRDLTEVRAEAIRRSGEILAIGSRRLDLGEEWRMEVTDELGQILFRLDFTVMETAATSSFRAVRDDLAPSEPTDT